MTQSVVFFGESISFDAKYVHDFMKRTSAILGLNHLQIQIFWLETTHLQCLCTTMPCIYSRVYARLATYRQGDRSEVLNRETCVKSLFWQDRFDYKTNLYDQNAFFLPFSKKWFNIKFYKHLFFSLYTVQSHSQGARGDQHVRFSEKGLLFCKKGPLSIQKDPDKRSVFQCATFCLLL